MEVGETVLALYFVDAELYLAEGVVFVFLEIGEGDFNDSAFKGVVRVFETGGSVYKGFADTAFVRVGVEVKAWEGKCLTLGFGKSKEPGIVRKVRTR